VTRYGRDELETRPELCIGIDCPSSNQSSGGFPTRTGGRISPLFPFRPDSGSASLSISASRAGCNEEKGHDDRFFSRGYATGVESRKTETRSNRRRIVEVRLRCPKADSLSGSFAQELSLTSACERTSFLPHVGGRLPGRGTRGRLGDRPLHADDLCWFSVNGKTGFARQSRRWIQEVRMDLSLSGQSREAEGRHRAARPGLGPWVGARVASPRRAILHPGPASLLRDSASGQFTVGTSPRFPRTRRVAVPRPLLVSSSARTRPPPHDRPACPPA
jgi:hypothetical protein